MALRYKTKIFLDHTLGVVLALVFKLAAKILSLLLHKADMSVHAGRGSLLPPSLGT